MTPRILKISALAAVAVLSLQSGPPAAADDAPDKTDPVALMSIPLEETYWRIVALAGRPIDRTEGGREAHMVFHPDGGLNATVGCNMMRGTYDRDGETLTFGPAATTMMACPPPLDEAERALIAVMEATGGYALAGNTLSLVDAEGETVAVLEAVDGP